MNDGTVAGWGMTVMDESPMSHAFGAVEFAGGIPLEEPSATRVIRRLPLPWRTYTRCLLLAVIVGAVGWIAFRPGMLRLSALLSLVSPSRGESLAWKPEAEDEPRLAPVKFTPLPGEWRLNAGHTANRLADRPQSLREDAWQGGALGAPAWKRASFNPWDWSDDAAREARRLEEQDNAPGQKAESSFRAGGAKDWPLAAAASAAPAATAFAETSAGRVPPLTPLPATVRSGPAATPTTETKIEAAPALSLPPAPLSIPQLPQLSAQQPEPPAASAPALERPATERIVSDPVTLSAPPAIGLPETINNAPQAQTAGTISPAQAMSAAFAAATPTTPAIPPSSPATTSAPTAPVSVPPAAPAPTDWKEREITAPIPGAYLTIYPKLKFIGLCVPGQGYIRKYNQIAVPMDLTEPKQHAADGRTPYGKYYVAGHVRDASGPRVVLSWPSADDARRAGVGSEMLALVESAWSRQAMPPQDSFAGGGLSLAGDRAAGEYTSGGFSLESPHMEEIFTALPDGAWVFVQQ